MADETPPAEAIRAALAEIPETVAHDSAEPPRPGHVYVVPGHEKALNPESPVVVGDRGTGKTFWSAALADPTLREHLIAPQFRRLKLESCDVSWGHASTPQEGYPSRKNLHHLRGKGWTEEDIWRAVILYHLAPVTGEPLPGGQWADRVAFVAKDPEGEERILRAADEALVARGKRHMIVFDALDRLGPDWRTIRDLVGSLLRVCLDLRGYRAIRPKLFMRPDMWEDRALWTFPDASKLHHGRVTLEWRSVDLYGLLWHWLANNEQSGHAFRNWAARAHGVTFKEYWVNGQVVHETGNELKADDKRQATLFAYIASPYMGRDRRRGKTYTWVPTHLADAKGRVSPRSFLIALRHAQEKTQEDGRPGILHYEGIKKGVQEASRIRREELQEDYPWIDNVLEALRGTTVPLPEGEAKRRWDTDIKETVLAPARNDRETDNPVPPHALEGLREEDDWADALIEVLVDIGVMYRLSDRRLNIPDLFRIPFGIGRKGGVKAIR